MHVGRVPSFGLALVLTVLAAPVIAPAFASSTSPHLTATYRQRIADGNRVGATITNYGVIGNNFVSRSASLEYPLGSGYEHMAHGGLWLGAQALDDQGAFVGVTTGVLDATQGSATQSLTEFTPAGDAIEVRSTLPNSPDFSPNAVSEQDFISEYVDVPSRTVPFNEPNRPLNVHVRQENYAWSLPGYADVLFFHYVIRNDGAPLQNLWAGIYTEFASGNKNAYATWPPSGWYGKKWLSYDDTLKMVREHYCASQPVPDGCNLAAVPPWIGLQMLGARVAGVDVSLQHTFKTWGWSPGNPDRNEDVERYALMSLGTVDPSPAFPPPDDPVELLAAGPFAFVAPGDSVEIDFALVGGGDPVELREHGALAKLTYDDHYVIVDTGVLVSRTGARATPDAVELEWRVAPSVYEVHLWRRRLDGGPHAEERLGRLLMNREGDLRYVDRDVTPGASYEYRLESEAHGVLDLVNVTVPVRGPLALERVDPNPTSDGRAQVVFTLPRAGDARLDVFDAQGRRLGGRFTSYAAGTNRVALDAIVRPSKAGLYFVRLEQDGITAWRRFALAP